MVSAQDDEPDWEVLYNGLEVLACKLSFPDDSLASISRALTQARQVETRATIYYTRTSRRLAQAKGALLRAKLIRKTSYQALMADERWQEAKTGAERKILTETALVDEDLEVEKAQNRVTAFTLFLAAVDKTLSAAKHNREDIGKKIKILDVQKEIGAT